MMHKALGTHLARHPCHTHDLCWSARIASRTAGGWGGWDGWGGGWGGWSDDAWAAWGGWIAWSGDA